MAACFPFLLVKCQQWKVKLYKVLLLEHDCPGGHCAAAHALIIVH